jgi:hypothetical protein
MANWAGAALQRLDTGAGLDAGPAQADKNSEVVVPRAARIDKRMMVLSRVMGKFSVPS